MRYSSETPSWKHKALGNYSINNDMFSVSVDPLDRDTYEANLESASLGSLSLAKIRTGGAIVSRQQEEAIHLDFKRYSFLFVLEGEMILSYNHGVRELERGDYLFIDNSYPRSMFVQRNVSLLIISLPGMVLKRYFSDTQLYEGLVMSNKGPNTDREQQAHGLILDNWEKIQEGSLRDFAPRITENLLNGLYESYKQQLHHNSKKRAIRICQAKELIEERLGNCGLTIESLAEELGVSSRYLRSLFTHTEKISHYIMRRRLEESAQRLNSPALKELSITAISQSCGFVNVAHFSRSFKKLYRITPRQYRKADHPCLYRRA